MKKAGSYGWRVVILAVTLLAIAGVVFTVMADSKVAGSVVARPITWLAPLIAGCVVLSVGGILLSQRHSDEGNTAFNRTRCPACEREVMGQWRMCPYCGAMLESGTA
jgi:hypothetical protein